MKESKRTDRFSVTLSFAPKRSFVWRALRRETQSNIESMRPLWFFHLYILSSATTALSTLCQGRLYPHIYIYIYIYVWIRSLCLIFPFYSARYVEVELDVYWDREKTEREYFHPYKSVSWLLTHKGILLSLLHFSYSLLHIYVGMYKVSGSVCALWNWIFFH